MTVDLSSPQGRRAVDAARPDCGAFTEQGIRAFIESATDDTCSTCNGRGTHASLDYGKCPDCEGSGKVRPLLYTQEMVDALDDEPGSPCACRFDADGGKLATCEHHRRLKAEVEHLKRRLEARGA